MLIQKIRCFPTCAMIVGLSIGCMGDRDLSRYAGKWRCDTEGELILTPRSYNALPAVVFDEGSAFVCVTFKNDEGKTISRYIERIDDETILVRWDGADHVYKKVRRAQ